MKKSLFFFILFLTSLLSFAQPPPANDNCAGAISLGTLPAPQSCTSGPAATHGVGATNTYNLTNVGATAPNPYTSLVGCQPTPASTNMASPAGDVWYTFVASGNEVFINITGGIANPNIALYAGTCANLSGRGCAVGSGNSLTCSFDQIVIGQTYFFQISGGSTTDTGPFTMTLHNDNACADCVVTANLTTAPSPNAGTYPPNTSVTFCYTINQWVVQATNWLHGVEVRFGPGWDLTTLSGLTLASPCGNNANWAWYNSCTSTATGVTYGTGFYYNTGGGGPGNNFGDPGSGVFASGCTGPWTFCWTIKTKPTCGQNLNIDINTLGDGESGSWSSVACQQDAEFNFLASNQLPNATAGPPSSICTGGSVTLGGPAVGTNTYSWTSSPAGFTSTSSNPTVSPTVTTTYTVTETITATGCSKTNSVTITVKPSPVITAEPDLPFCAGATVPLNSFVSTPAGATFAWTNSAASIGLAASGTGSLPSFTATNITGAPVTATITVTPTLNGCTGPNEVFTITINPIPVSTFTQSANQCLTGNSFSFNNTGSTGAAFSNAWTFAGGTPSTSTLDSPSPITFTTSGTHAIQLVVTGPGGCTSTTNSNITIFAMPTGSITAQTNVLCNGGNTGSVTVAGASTSGYSYSINGGATYQASGTFGSLTAGPYTITIKDVNGCTVTVPVTITQPTVLTGSITAQTNVLCNGASTGSVTVAGAGGTSPYTYAINGVTFGASGTFGTLAAGPYTITVKDFNGCTTTVPVTITQPTVLTGSITAQTNVLCNGASTGSVTVAGAAGTPTYTYAINGVTFGASGTFGGLAAGGYTITVKDANGCLKTVPVTITQPTLVTVSSTKTDATCGAANGSLTATGAGGTSPYTYAINGVTFQASGTFSSLASGTYTVTVKDANGCTNTNPITINNLSGLVASITSQTNVLCNGASTGSVTVTGSGSLAPYTYAINGVTFVASGTFSGLAAGPYTITVKDGNGCTVTVPVTITQPTPVTGAITAQTNVLCNGGATGSVTVAGNNGTPGYTYAINGVTFVASGTFSALAAGPYTITVKDLNGCTTTVPVTITQPTLLTGSITAQTNVLCNGASTGSVTVAGAGGTSPYTYAIDGATFGASGTFSALTAGSYTITVKDANGCLKTVPVTITQPTLVTVSATKADATCGASNGSITATGAGGTGAYTYSINGVAFQASGTFASQAAGSYTITVKDANGCTNTTPITINDLSGLSGSITAQTNVNCAGANNGSVTVAGAGTSGYTYSINGVAFQASGTFSSLGAGSYTITVKDVNSCTVTVPVTITAAGAVSGSITAQTNVLCNGASTGSVTVAGSSGTPGYTYAINGVTFGASGTFSALAAGPYTVTVKDVNGCTTTVPVTITQPTLLTGSITAQTNILCNGASTGDVTVAGAGGTSPYTYAKDGVTFGASGTFGSLAAGSYTITVKDANGCLKTIPVTITQPTLVTVSATKTDATCGAANGSLTATGAGGTATYSYSINGITFVASGNFTALAAGAYTVTVKDANGCTNTTPVTINDLSGLIASISAQTNVSCNGGNNGSVTVTASGSTGPYTYSLGGGPYQGSGTFNTLIAGSYTITAKDANGCTITVPVTITEPLALTGAITAQTNILCNGGNTGSVTVAGSNGTSPYTYAINGVTFGASGTFSPLTAGSYTVTVKDSKGCTFPVPVSITQPTALTASITAQTNNACFGGNTGSVTVTAAGGTTAYSYSLSGGPSQPTGTFSTMTVGSYTVTVTDGNTCTTTVPVTITQPTQVTVSAVKTDATCGAANGSITATGANGTGGYTYSINGGATYQASNNFPNLAASSYTVTVKDANSCTNTTTISIVDLSGLVASITAQTNVSCNGGNNGSVTITASGSTGPYTYALGAGPFGGSGTFGSLTQGSYNITAKDANGCTVVVPVTITQPAVLNATIASQTAVSCFGGNNGSVTINATGGTTTYLYNIDGGPFGGSATFSGLNSGSHPVIVKDAKGCTFNVPVMITEPPALTLATSTTNSVCTAANGSATVVASGGTPNYTYAWAPTAGSSSTLNNIPAGNYSVLVTDNNGCTQNALVTVTANPGGSAVISSTTNVTCTGANDGTATVSMGGASTPPFTYAWNPTSQTTTTAINLAPASYTVTVTDGNGCIATATTIITGPSVITSSFVTVNVTCNAGTNGQATVTAAGGTAPYTYLWLPGGQTSATATNLSAGTYTLTITDANGCTKTASTAITEPPAITLTSTHIDANCNQSNGSATVNPAGGTGPYTYSWGTTPVQTTQTAINLAANSYMVTVTDNNTCTQTLVVTVNDLAGPVATLVSSTNVSCFGQNNGSATTTVNGGSSPYTFSWNNGQSLPTATNLTAGSYTMTATDQNGCIASVSATITEPTALVTNFTAINPRCFGSSNGSINTNTNGGTTPYTYLWSPGSASTNNLSNLTAGTYSLQVTDNKGCTTLTPVTLTQPVAITATAISQNVTCSGLCNGTATANPGSGNSPFTYLWSDPNGQSTQIANGLCGGTYTVTVTDANGCSAIATTTVAVPNAMTIAVTAYTDVTCYDAKDGSAQTIVNGGTPGYTYNWMPGSTGGSSVTNLDALTYTVTVTDGNGCTASTTQLIRQPNPLIPSITHTDVTCYGMCDAQATAFYTGGTGPYTFLWTASMQTTPTALNLCAGVQSMTITDAHNCSANATVVIQEPTVLAVSTTATTSNCGNADGGACAQITGGTPPFTYSWNDPATQTTSCAINLNANAYTISITDAHGCSATNIANVNDITAPVVTIASSTNVSCAGASDGTAQANIAGGTLPYSSVVWTPTGQTSSFANNLPGGQYSIVVTDAAGCRGSNNVSITEPFPLVSAITSTNASCFLVCDGTATANVGGGTTPYTYLWNDPGSQTSATANNLCAQTYTVTVTDANGCTSTSSKVITQPSQLNITPNTITNVSCNGGSNGSVATTITGGSPGYTYLWTPSNQANTQATNLTAGSYTLLVTDSHQCTKDTTYVITEPSALVLTPNSNPSTCGNPNGSVGVSVTAGSGTAPYSYFWSPSAQTSAIISNVAAGSYTVTVTDAQGCIATSTSVVNNLAGPTINNVIPVTPQCYNTPTGSATVSVTGGQLPYVYSWANSSGALGQNSATATGLVAGTYFVTVTDLNTCATTGSVIVSPATPVVILPVPTDTICIGQSSQIFAAASGGTPNYVYTWNPTVPGPGPIYNVSPTSTTVYTVTAKDDHSCLSAPQTVTVFVNPQIKVVASDTSVCDGLSVPIFATPSGGTGGPYTYNWSNGPTTQNQTVSPTGTGSVKYVVTLNDGCSIAVYDTSTVVINPLPFGTINVIDPDGCEPFSASFLGNSTPGVTYSWNFGDGFTSQTQNTSHVYNTIGGVVTSYPVSLTVTSLLGCSKTYTTAPGVTVYPTPQAAFSSTPDQPTTTSPVVTFNDQSTGATEWDWDFIYTTPPLGLYTDTLQNPTFSYPDSGTYVVQQIVSNAYNCYDTAYNIVEVVPEYILYAPNAFTPFNHDGLNDLFMPKGLGIDPDNFEMMIFDRWGNLIFKTNDIAKGWDGKANGGSKVAQADVYVWKIATKDFKGEHHNYIGHVSIVR